MQVKANGINIEVETFGDKGNPTIIFVMGFGAQLTGWPVEMMEGLVDRGFHVVRFDNRDVGLSQKFPELGQPNAGDVMAKMVAGETPDVPYTLTDMAADAVGVLDALGIDKAHIVGGSMGGMIVQLAAAGWPERFHSMTSVFSTTGNQELPPSTDEALAALLSRPENEERDTVVAHQMKVRKVIGSPGYPTPEDEARRRAEETFDRSYYPGGTTRQYAAIIADGDRRERIKSISCPVLVLHGVGDPLVRVEGGRDTAANIPGARLVEIEGWGHDLPVQLVPQLVDEIAAHCSAAGSKAAAAE
ncbi:alpha/beta fold hydrolase [Pyruvatibacter mobilis]|uniref:alpha/beta fold hydrolase n=1 Tax=Pyruvatibacter mobilis TaxID=1712261 RepID=UPI003C798C4A